MLNMRATNGLVATLCSLLLATAAAACPVQAPVGMHSTAVGDDVFINGLRMSIRQVQAAEKTGEIFLKAEKQWNADGYAVRRGDAVGWQVLTVIAEQCLATLQLTDRGGAFGYFARSRKDPRPISMRAARAPLPANATVTSTVESNDDGRKGLVVSMTSTSPVEELQRAFVDRLNGAKWKAQRAHTIKNKATGVSALFLTAQREREQVDIVLWSDGGTQAVMTIAEAL